MRNPFALAASSVFAAGKFIWRWSVPYKSGHCPDDKIYAAVWKSPVDSNQIIATLAPIFPDVALENLPVDEEHIRHLLRDRFPPPVIDSSSEDLSGSETTKSVTTHANVESAEETWEHLPENLRYLLASLNAHHVELKLQSMLDDAFHTKAGRNQLKRSGAGIRKTFAMWRNGFTAAVSRKERYAVNLFFIFLAFSACYPDVAAGFLGERSYNQRSIGSRIVTLCQLFFLRTYDYPSLWLLFNWSLERLLGAFVGNTVYALAAVIPALRLAHKQAWFRAMMLALSMSWQVGVQFSPPVRDYIVRLLIRRQMLAKRKAADVDSIDWSTIVNKVRHELIPLPTYNKLQHVESTIISSEDNVPFKVRTERFIQFTACFKLGRPADQLVGLLKDDFESIINAYEDYNQTAPQSDNKHIGEGEKSHIEPRAPKFLLVVFDICIFAYVCYSFYPQPFTFNTVVAYGTVVILKQAILAVKKYQTLKGARRLFTNMVSINIIGMLLVSTPVTIDRNILANDANFIALTLAMVFATIFLAEPIAPILLTVTEKLVDGFMWMKSKLSANKGKSISDGSRSDTDASSDREGVPSAHFSDKGAGETKK